MMNCQKLSNVICVNTGFTSTTLKKQMNINHTNQKRFICSVEFKTSIDILSQIAKQHHDEEEVRLQSTPKSDNKQEKADILSRSDKKFRIREILNL